MLKDLLKSAEDGRKQLLSLSCYENDLSLSGTIEYYCFVSQIVDSFPVAEESIPCYFLVIFVAYWYTSKME